MNRKEIKKSVGFRFFTTVLTIVLSVSFSLPVSAQGLMLEKSVSEQAFPKKISIPESMAFTDERYEGKGDQGIWIVSDAHAVASAQNAIYKTIGFLEEHADLRLVGVEGVSGDFQTALLRSFPDHQKLHDVMKTLESRGELAGPSLSAILNSGEAQYIGAEDSKLYEEGLDHYSEVKELKANFEFQINAIEEKISQLKEKHFSAELLKFTENRSVLNQNKAKVLASILETAQNVFGDISERYPHLAALTKETASSSEFSHAALLEWAKQIRLRIKDQDSKKEWVEKEQAWKTGTMSDSQFAYFALSFCKTNNWQPKIPEALLLLASRGELLARMKSAVFVKEWDHLLKQVEDKLAVTAEAKELLELTRNTDLLKDWIALELNRQNWDRAQTKFNVNGTFFKAEKQELELLRARLEKSAFAHFYKNAVARENTLLENTLLKMRDNQNKKALLVVGGFHTEALAKLLKEKNISYSLLTPSITELPKESGYSALMQGDVSWKSFLKTGSTQLNLYESFAKAMIHELLDLKGAKQNPSTALRYYKSWRENILRHHGSKQALEALALLDDTVLEAVYSEEYRGLKQRWDHLAPKLLPRLEHMSQAFKAAAPSVSKATMNAAVVNPLVRRASIASSLKPQPRVTARRETVKKREPAGVRSEVRALKLTVKIFFEGPDAKFGGVGDVAVDLPAALTKATKEGEEVITIIPWHEGRVYEGARFLNKISFDSQEGVQTFEAFEWIYQGTTYHLLRKEGEELFGGNYSGDLFRTAVLFSKASVEYLAQSGIQPSILNADDQMAAYVPALVRHTRNDFFNRTAVVYTAHHLAPEYQGAVYDFQRAVGFLMGVGLNDFSLYQEGGDFYLQRPGHDHPHINPTRAAIRIADGVNTVDPEFAREAAIGPGYDFTEGLRHDLYWRWQSQNPNEKTFIGIGNALDGNAWNPATAEIGHRKSEHEPEIIIPGQKLSPGSDFLEWKIAQKVALQQRLGLVVDASAPVIFLASRLTRVKGLDSVPAAIPHILQRFPNAQLVVAGSGEDRYEESFKDLAKQPIFQGRFNFRNFFLSAAEMREGFAAATHFLSPTTIAPYEIAPSQAKIAGTPTIATNTGGLIRVTDPDLDQGAASSRLGWRFGGLLNASPEGLAAATAVALMDYQYRLEQWQETSSNVRRAVPRWEPVAESYRNFYLRALGNRLDFIGDHEAAKAAREQSTARSESRALRKEGAFVNPTDFPYLSEHIVYSRQVEAGWPRHILESIENAAIEGEDALIKEFGISPELAATLVSQINLTGGLGALMPDLFEAWEANGLPVTGINPLWNYIKNRPDKAVGEDGKKLMLGEMAKQKMELTDIEFEVKLPISSRYRSYAKHSGANALLTREGHKQIKVRVYKTETHVHKAPQYYLDAYYVEDGKEIPIFGEVYDDDEALRDFHMAIFNQGSQKLIQKLENNNDPEDVVLLDHEVFTSLPATELKSAKRMGVNHTVFRPGLYEPSEDSYELLGFPEWLRSTIAHDEKISIADYTAEDYDLLTGVGLVEHVPALHENIFRWGWHKLRGFYDSIRRSTNGVFLPRWQTNSRRLLIEDFKNRLKVPAPKFGLPDEANDKAFFAELNKPENKKLKDKFIVRNEAIGAVDASKLLIWLYEKHGFKWLEDSLGDLYDGKMDAAAIVEQLKLFHKQVEPLIKGGERRDSLWGSFFQQDNDLIQALLRDPIGANVRRQVPYKGPDKYVEILESTLGQAEAQVHRDVDHKALFEQMKGDVKKGDFSNSVFQEIKSALSQSEISEDLRENMARVIIGGRTFDIPAYDRFLYIRFMSNLLGIESRFATVENYNYHEAHLIFAGSQAGIMLSDEILEASATSMEKAQTNMGEVVGVFGGAVPEIWVIQNVKTKEIQEVLDQDGEPAMTHDELREKLAKGEWEILNGILVEYEDGSQSKQVGGLRRPSATSLVAALKTLRTTRGQQETRRQRMYDTLASSWKVDMVTSQAQAHAYLLEGMLEKKAKEKELSAATDIVPQDLTIITGFDSFDWNVNRENLQASNRGGLIGFVSAFRWLKNWKKPDVGMASRGEDALAALRFHAPRGDIFNYLLTNLAVLSDEVEPLRQRIRELQREAQLADKERIVIARNLEAIELVDQFLLGIAGQWLEEYIASDDVLRLEELRNLLTESTYVNDKTNEPQQPWAGYLARYLDEHPNASALSTSDSRVRSFVFETQEKSVLISLSVNASSAEEKDIASGRIVRKARATVYFNTETANALGGEAFESQQLVRVIEPKLGKTYKLHPAGELKQSLGVGVPLPFGVEVLEWTPDNSELAGLFQKSFLPQEAFGATHALGQLLQRAQILVGSKQGDLEQRVAAEEQFANELQILAQLDARSSEHLFSVNGRKAVLAFILATAPEHLDSFKHWDRDFYSKLDLLKRESPEFFTETPRVHLVPSSRNGTLVFAREDTYGNLFFISLLFHVNDHEINQDGKVNTTVTGLENIFKNHAYEIKDGLTGQAYGIREKSDLLDSWNHRIPVANHSQLLILKRASQRSESRLKAGEASTSTSLKVFATIAFAFFADASLPTVSAAEVLPAYAASELTARYPDDYVPKTIIGSFKQRVSLTQRLESRSGRSESRLNLNIELLEAKAVKHFSVNPDEPLHLGFAIPYSSQIEEDFLAYAEKIHQLQSRFGSRVINHLALWVDSGNQNQVFQSRVSQLGVKVIRLEGSPAARAQQITSHLSSNPEVFAFGLDHLGISVSALSQNVRHLVVSADYSLEAVFSPAVVLNTVTASEGKISAQAISNIPSQLTFVGFKSGSLTLLDSILDRAMFEAQVSALIATMA